MWKHALNASLNLPSPDGHGWMVKDEVNNQPPEIIEITWVTVPPAPQALLELVSCKCRTGCSTCRCSCFNSDLLVGCTDVCQCCDCKNGRHQASDLLAAQPGRDAANSDRESDAASAHESESDDSDSEFHTEYSF